MDYMIIDKDHLQLVEDSTIHQEYYGSDHCPIKMRFNLNKLPQNKRNPLGDEEEASELDELD